MDIPHLSRIRQRGLQASSISTVHSNETSVDSRFEGTVAASPKDVFPYTTLCFLWFLHVVYFYQWKRRRRKSSTVCLHDLVVRRRYDKLWLALFSTFGAEESRQQPSSFDTLTNESSSLAVPMGHTFENPPQYTLLYQPYLRNFARTFSRFYIFIGGKAALRLFYYSHLIWSCRALETHFGSSVRYLAIILSCVAWDVGLMTWIHHRAAQLLPSSRERILTSDLTISPIVFCITLVVTFHFTFPHTVIPAIPFFYFPHSNAFTGYIALLVPLSLLSTLATVGRIGFYSIVWTRLGMPNIELFALLGLVLMSHHWLDSVGWHRNTGNLRVYDEETRLWCDYEPYMDTEIIGSPHPNVSDSYSGDFDDNSIATGSSNEEVELGETTSAAADERTPLTGRIWRNEMRSRRGATQNID